jgi:hypothetical protein
MRVGVMLLLLLLTLGLHPSLVGLEHGHLSFAHRFGAETAAATGGCAWRWWSGVGVGTGSAVAGGVGVRRVGMGRGLVVWRSTSGVTVLGLLRLAMVERFWLLTATIDFLMAELFELLMLLALLVIMLLLTLKIHVSLLLMLPMMLLFVLLLSVLRMRILLLLLLMTM